jgi:DHA2 family lincomycin resistance protein-like MFS transporter
MELATHNVIAVDRNSSLEDVCRVLSSTKVKKVPVLDHGKLVGTFSRSDLLRFFLASQTARASRAHTTAGAARTAATGIQNA